MARRRKLSQSARGRLRNAATSERRIYSQQSRHSEGREGLRVQASGRGYTTVQERISMSPQRGNGARPTVSTPRSCFTALESKSARAGGAHGGGVRQRDRRRPGGMGF